MSRLHRHRRRRQSLGSLTLDGRINITPFVDVVLVLLIVFMITAPLLTTTVPINLPVANGLASNAPAPVVVTVRDDGQAYLDNDLLADDESLLTALTARRQEVGESATVFVRADRAVSYGRFVQVVSTIRAAQFHRLSIVSLPAADSTSPPEPAASAPATASLP